MRTSVKWALPLQQTVHIQRRVVVATANEIVPAANLVPLCVMARRQAGKHGKEKACEAPRNYQPRWERSFVSHALPGALEAQHEGGERLQIGAVRRNAGHADGAGVGAWFLEEEGNFRGVQA